MGGYETCHLKHSGNYVAHAGTLNQMNFTHKVYLYAAYDSYNH